MFLRTRLAGPIAALMLATTAAAEDAPTADTVLATVNGTEITVGHVIALVSRLPERFQALKDEDLYTGVLEQLIQQTALGAGMDRDTRSVELAIENEVRALLATERLKEVEAGAAPTRRLPKTIDLTVDYLRSGLPRDAYARARIIRSGRRYASVHVEGWQDNRNRMFAQATGHFLMPARDG